MPSQHGIVGDEFGTDLPQTQITEDDLAAERNAAKFSKSREFKTLKEHLERRKTFYQNYLPDGRSIIDVDTAERAHQWVIATAIIGELQAVIDTYENAAEIVKNASR